MSTNTNRSKRDEDCEAEAAEARRQGTELIENHLSSHLVENPDSSFVTWIATLYPENADVTIDERFFVSGNPWWAVYEGAKNDIPIATAVPVNDEIAADHEDVPTSTHVPNKSCADTNSSPSSNESKRNTSCNPIDSFIGFILILISALTVFALELTACLIYGVAAFFWNAAKSMGPPNVINEIFWGISMLVYWALAIVDSSLLLASVITTELMAGVCYMLSLLFAGCDEAASWHRYIRKTCHMLRWAFRSQSVAPSRHVCGCGVPKDYKDEAEDEDKKVGQVNKPQQHAAATPIIVVLDEKDVVVNEGGRKDSTFAKGDTFTFSH